MVVDYQRLQRRAEDEGCACVVAAVILDPGGRVFTPRRALTAAMLPGLWDLVGGHVEAGESLLAALEREVAEETGWRVTGEPLLVFVSDWTFPDDSRRHREFDFLVEVIGDLSAPRLRPDEHDDFRWVDPSAVALFDANGGRDDGLVRRAVEVGLRCADPGVLTYPHVTLFVPDPVATRVDRLRKRWDPAMADEIAPHVTVAYPDELGTIEAALAFLDSAARQVASFELRLGDVVHDGDPSDGVFIEVDDVEGAWARLRRLAVASSGEAAHDVPPHVTIVHPRTSALGALAWTELGGLRMPSTSLDFTSIAVTAFDGRRWRTVGERSLGSRP